MRESKDTMRVAGHPRVIAVVVAYNREDLLIECLEALRAQTRRLDGVVIIDNASTDASADRARALLPDAHVVTLRRNLGGAGGFTAGIALAISEANADLVWLLDDDTVPTEGALAALLEARRLAPPETVLVASRVVWTDGRPHPMNMPRVRPWTSKAALRSANEHGCYPVRSTSFVSVLIEVSAIRVCGLPVAGYFLWNDDFEYTARLLRYSRGYICNGSLVVHKTKVYGSTDADPGPRFSLEVRNKVWLMKKSRSLALPEKVLYCGATAVRWVRTWRVSRDRRTITRSLREGLREGLWSAPATNGAIFKSMPEIAESIAHIEPVSRRLQVERVG
ncbi:glycosyltransferase [Humibacter ginsengiterrae]